MSCSSTHSPEFRLAAKVATQAEILTIEEREKFLILLRALIAPGREYEIVLGSSADVR